MVFRCVVFFFKQKTAYEMRISDWSSDVCSSDLKPLIASSREFQELDPRQAEKIMRARRRDLDVDLHQQIAQDPRFARQRARLQFEIGRASCRERVCQYV